MNNRISIISLAVFMASILLMLDYVVKPAYAFTFIDITTTGSNNRQDLVDKTSSTPCRFYTLTVNQGVTVINCDTHTIVSNNITLGTTGTACQSLSGIAGCNLGVGTFSGIECNQFFCFLRFNNATRELLVRYNVGSFTEVTGWLSNGVGSPIDVDGIDLFSSSGGDATVLYAFQCSGADTDRIIGILNGASMVFTGNVDGASTCATASGTGGNLGASSVNDIHQVVIGTVRHLAVSTDAGANNFRLFRLDTNVFMCQKTSATNNEITYNPIADDFLGFANALNGDIDIIDADTCADNGDVTDTTMGTTGFTIKGGDVNTGRKEIYTSATNAKVIAINATNYGKVFEHAISSTSPFKALAMSFNSSEIVIAQTNGASTRFIILGAGGATTPAGTVCIETVAGSGIADLCFTDTDGNGVADNGGLGSLGVYRSNANLTSFGNDVFCSFGINTNACTNKDIKTNGVGLFYLLFLIIFSYALLVLIHYQAQHMIAKNNVQVMDTLHINPVLLLVMLMVDMGIAFYMQWIPDIIFYTVLVIMVGLAGFGVYKKLSSGGNG